MFSASDIQTGKSEETKTGNQRISLSPFQLMVIMAVLIITTAVSVFFNIPFLRTISSFVLLTFIPGFLLLWIFKLNRLGWWEKIALSVGLSLAFLFLLGLLHNGLLSVLGYEKPLSTMPLLISFSTATLVLTIVAFARSKSNRFLLPEIKLTTKEKALLILPAFFPLLSILGTYLMNTRDNNLLLMLLLFLIPAYVIFISVYHKKIPARIYPGFVFLISISLVLMFALRSNEVILGADTGQELYYFNATLANQKWSVIDLSLLNSCLSISLLPSIYQNFLGISPELVFKLIYAPLFSIMPVGVYILSRKFLGSYYAFLASFFFMSQGMFLAATSNIRSSMAILFAILAVMALFHDEISNFNRRLLFTIFVICTVLSHYATSYPFFFILCFTWTGTLIMKAIFKKKEGLDLPDHYPGEETGNPRDSTAKRIRIKQKVTAVSLILFLALIFLWYSQITVTSFGSGVRFVQVSALSLQEFFNPASTNVGVPLLFGMGWTGSGITYKIAFVSRWATYLLIGVGAVSLLFGNRKASVVDRNSKSGFSERTLETEYLMIMLACSLLLIAGIIVPYVSLGYALDRLYLLTAAMLSVSFILGGIRLAKYLKAPSYLVILLVLVVYFMGTTGSLGQVTGVPEALTLNSQGIYYDLYYVHDQESCAAKWLRNYGELDNTIIYTDHMANERLMGWGPISPSLINSHSFVRGDIDIKGYVYLRYYNVVNGQLVGLQRNRQIIEHNIVEYQDKFDSNSKIYTNGGSEVYKF